jgi:hypothetical protein
MHDVAMRGRDFGVWKVWAELEKRGRSATFEQSPGLGVWEKPPSGPLPPLLEKLFASPNNQGQADFTGRPADYEPGSPGGGRRDDSFRAMAEETVIQIFWSVDGNYRRKNRPTPVLDTTTGRRLRSAASDWAGRRVAD